MAEPTPFKYRAFLSYSHRDKTWGTWLHRALETHRIDKDMVGRDTPAGPVPKTLRPIFRDREDFSAGHSLTAQTIAALEASQFLIVVCSPNAAKSQYVNEEIRRFKALGRADRVIPVIVDGEPGGGGDPARECFPQTLRFKVDADGALTGEREEPIAADAREEGDGKDLAKRKVIAGLLGLPLDEVVRRAERARRRRQRFWVGMAGVFLILAVTATGSAVYAWQQLKTNEALLDRTLQRATNLVNTAVAQADQLGVSRALTLRLLEQAEGLFEDMSELGRETSQLRYRKAWMLIEFARNYEILGDTNRQRQRAFEAHRLLAGLAAERPDDLTYQRDLSTAHDTVGDVLMTQGNLADALAAFRAAIAIRERLAKADPDNAARQRDLLVSYVKIGDVLAAQGDLPAALTSFRAGLASAERLAKADPENDDWQRDLSVSHERIGDVLWTLRNLPEALISFRASLAIVERLAGADPDNVRRQRDLSIIHNKVGQVLVMQDNLPEALNSFRASLAIRERLNRADPNNAAAQYDLGISHERIGTVFRAQGDLDAAMTSFNARHDIIGRLAKADPDNTDWQRDLSVSHERIGDVQLAQGQLPAALTSFGASLAIRERLTRTDPGNAGWQRELAISHTKVAAVYRQQDRSADALAALHKARQIMSALAARAPDHTGWQRDLAWLDRQIAGLEEKPQPAPQ